MRARSSTEDSTSPPLPSSALVVHRHVHTNEVFPLVASFFVMHAHAFVFCMIIFVTRIESAPRVFVDCVWPVGRLFCTGSFGQVHTDASISCLPRLVLSSVSQLAFHASTGAMWNHSLLKEGVVFHRIDIGSPGFCFADTLMPILPSSEPVPSPFNEGGLH